MRSRPLILLTLALVFSSIVRLQFRLYDGFEFYGFWMTPPITFLSFSNRNNSLLTTTFIGYLIYVWFGILEYKKANRRTEKYKLLTLFIIFCVAAAGYEISQIINDFQDEFHGKHFQCGPLIFIGGLWILRKKEPIPS